MLTSRATIKEKLHIGKDLKGYNKGETSTATIKEKLCTKTSRATIKKKFCTDKENYSGIMASMLVDLKGYNKGEIVYRY